MTAAQLLALQSYIVATVRVLTDSAGAHAQNMQLFVDSKLRLEAAFGKSLDNVRINPPALPDLL